VEAMTGSGKTIAYCIPVFEILMKATRNHESNSGSRSSSSASCNVDKDRTAVFVNKQDVYAMIIAPTR
jgi:superfamily II DNA/RNA helicase